MTTYQLSTNSPAQHEKIVYDFRSDTVTKPTPDMLQAMIQVKVGDDVKNEDPTVNQLQDQVAKLCRKEASLFVCSGVMSNQLAIRTHVTMNMNREVVAQQIICDERSHIHADELGGIAFLSGCQVKAIHAENYLTAALIEQQIQTANNLHTTLTTIISLENTLNGDLFPLEELKKIRQIANKYKLAMHLDGARLWNACIATNLEMHEYTQYFDSISLCLSKGLGAPIGSMLVGNKVFIEKARQYRKLFGGGWRQAGNLAACGIYAIEHNWKRMEEDHANTRILYEKLIAIGFELPVPQTNMVFPDSTKLRLTFDEIIPEMNLQQSAEEEKVIIEGSGYRARIVIHLQTPKEAIDKIGQLLHKSIASLQQKSK